MFLAIAIHRSEPADKYRDYLQQLVSASNHLDPVGTFTACTMKVTPNKAITTVTTADSKYSRITLFGGPCTVTGGGTFFS